MSFAAKCNVSVATLYNWEGQHPEFLEAKKRGEAQSFVHWEDLGLEMAEGKVDGNPTIWIFNMKNRFGWKDKQEIEQQVQGHTEVTHTVEPQELLELVQKAQKEKQK